MNFITEIWQTLTKKDLAFLSLLAMLFFAGAYHLGQLEARDQQEAAKARAHYCAQPYALGGLCRN